MTVQSAPLVVAIAAFVLMAPSAASAAPQPAAPAAGCVGLITSYEASQLPPGSVGREVSGLAASGPGLGRVLVSTLAQSHPGSLEGCI